MSSEPYLVSRLVMCASMFFLKVLSVLSSEEKAQLISP
jgi:hypothetical protein